MFIQLKPNFISHPPHRELILGRRANVGCVCKAILLVAVQFFPFCILQRRRKFGKAGAGANFKPRQAIRIWHSRRRRPVHARPSRRISNAFWRAFTYTWLTGGASEMEINLSAENWERCEGCLRNEGPNFARLALAAKRQV